MTFRRGLKSAALGGVAALILVGCGSGGAVTVVDDPKLESEFDTVLTTGQQRSLGEITEAGGLDSDSWDRMYYFSAPLLMSEINRSLGTEGVVWEGLPGDEAKGILVFTSGGDVVTAVIDHKPAVLLSGYATADSMVGPDQAIADYERVAVESRGH
ncbi:hypothetical protein [Rhodococcus artemisiae]|uniref:Lipoprotein n=1 Tax=Rhodococcus artemisiae TaxID=714159 RepID=A0ABU7LIM9_9NOCA|nr:hypothetical protein [Rhodococcus artemisiae]MEE2061428.1 hypothetical protein [Rhodococcus artemisiae]